MVIHGFHTTVEAVDEQLVTDKGPSEVWEPLDELAQRLVLSRRVEHVDAKQVDKLSREAANALETEITTTFKKAEINPSIPDSTFAFERKTFGPGFKKSQKQPGSSRSVNGTLAKENRQAAKRAPSLGAQRY